MVSLPLFKQSQQREEGLESEEESRKSRVLFSQFCDAAEVAIIHKML
jgi:hypothetical protein